MRNAAPIHPAKRSGASSTTIITQAAPPTSPQIEAPLLSAGNWGGMGLHTRGNFEGYLRAGSKQKWLEVHGDTHFTHFYSNYGETLQKRFFGHFLKGEDTGWSQQPRVSLNIRHPHENFVLRAETNGRSRARNGPNISCNPRQARSRRSRRMPTATLDYDTTGDGLTFRTPPMAESFEITGPVAAKLWLSSPTSDADVFLVAAAVRSRPEGSHLHRLERSAGAGRARLAARLAAQARSGTVDCRIAPGTRMTRNGHCGPASRSSSISKSGRLRLWCRRAIGSRSPSAAKTTRSTARDVALPNAPYPMKGVGPFLHIDSDDRPVAIFATRNTLHFAETR